MVRALICGILIVSAAGCHGLPGDFLELPLEEKIDAAIDFYDGGGLSNSRIESGISLHGVDAAEAMIPYLQGEAGLPVDVALSVVEHVQLRGCPLAGTQVEAEVAALVSLATPPEVGDHARDVLDTIRSDIRLPDLIDGLGPGACAAGAEDTADAFRAEDD